MYTADYHVNSFELNVLFKHVIFMSDNLSTQLPNPPELQPLPDTRSRLWRLVSSSLIGGGIVLIGAGAWIFFQQQVELYAPPARILEVSVSDLEPSPSAHPSPTVGSTPIVGSNPVVGSNPAEVFLQSNPTPPATEPTITLRETTSIEPTTIPNPAPARPTVSKSVENAAAELNPISGQAEPSARPKIIEQGQEATATPQNSSALSAGQDTTNSAVITDKQVEETLLSLADNPLLVVEDEKNSASNQTPAHVPDSTEMANNTASSGSSLTRITAESIKLDAEVIEIGWHKVIQNGIVTNVWAVADYVAGRHKNSALPGQGGNIVLSAHHNIKGEIFRYTLNLEPGDIITLYDETTSYQYIVEDKFIVKDRGEPDAVRRENNKWIGPFNEERLTLVTCWPFNSNTHRLIVIAKPNDPIQITE